MQKLQIVKDLSILIEKKLTSEFKNVLVYLLEKRNKKH